jgi:hypothetical protein
VSKNGTLTVIQSSSRQFFIIIIHFISALYLFTCQLNNPKANYQVGRRQQKEKVNTNIEDNNSNFYNARDHLVLSSLKRKGNYLQDAIKQTDILQTEK